MSRQVMLTCRKSSIILAPVRVEHQCLPNTFAQKIVAPCPPLLSLITSLVPGLIATLADTSSRQIEAYGRAYRSYNLDRPPLGNKKARHRVLTKYAISFTGI
jgi:hypothetical protein